MLYFQKGWPQGNLKYPLSAIPPDIDGSEIVSPVAGRNYSLPAPSMPGSKEFEEELNEVIEVRMLVLGRKWPSDFLAKHHPRGDDFDPEKIPGAVVAAAKSGVSISNPASAAMAVHKDHPLDLATAAQNWILKQGVRLKDMPHDDQIHRQFNGQPNLQVHRALAHSTIMVNRAKWFFGRPRPEEAIAAGYGSINAKELITAYPEGCPNHPAYPARHASSAAAARMLIRGYDLTEEQQKEVYDCAYHWAMYRVFAGVHYASDCLTGLLLGGLFYENGILKTVRIIKEAPNDDLEDVNSDGATNS